MSDEAKPFPAAGPRLAFGPLVAGAVFLFLALVPLMAEVWGGSYLTSLAIRAMILAIIAISLDLLLGHGGLVSFGHSAFVAIGAYATGIMITEGIYEMALILPVAIGAAALFALASGAISMRTTGVSFIMITLAFGQMVYFALGSLAQYGADDGLTLWSAPDFFGTGWLASDAGVYATVLAVLIATWAIVHAMVHARFGRVLRAARQNPTRVASMGYSVYNYRLTAYVIAGVIAAIAGVLWATHAEFVSPSLGSWQRSGDLIVIVVLGGMATRNGALIGAIFFVMIEEILSSITHDWRLIFGPILILIALFARGGLAGLIDRVKGPAT
ncbi:branched-chain amino acid ABC transporter permease [Aestuariibius sp. 2305UL40-4]|uniref:branched-chain amino acid ABC transporter permease n=1 Tax=Aestuariibius violaceus TaxID=3234132 RepID=UPI00345E600E